MLKIQKIKSGDTENNSEIKVHIKTLGGRNDINMQEKLREKLLNLADKVNMLQNTDQHHFNP